MNSVTDKTPIFLNRLVKFSLVVLVLALIFLGVAWLNLLMNLSPIDFVKSYLNITPLGQYLAHFFGAPIWQWSVQTILSVMAWAALAGLLITFYLDQPRPRAIARHPWMASFLILFFMGLVWFMLPQDKLFYLLPIATLSILLTVLMGFHFSMLITLLAGLLLGYISGGSLEVAVYTIMGGLMGSLSLKGQITHVNRLLRAGVYVALANLAVAVIFHPPGSATANDMLSLIGIGITNGILAAGLTLSGLFLLDNLFGVTTSLRLSEFAQLTHPLLQELLKRAPGTYDHSLVVSHLTEQAVERIGGDAYLTQVGTHYHDVGKMVQPEYFVENQQDDGNPLDDLLPVDSAKIIISHVKEGLKLAKKYHLPQEVRAFIAEHHGTTLVKYFYHQAGEHAANPAEVHEADFRYPGPKPHSKETAILMLADSCEAAVRAEQPATLEELDQLVRQIIADRVADGQFSECDLTIHDLELIRQTFMEILQGMRHHRVEYPAEAEEAENLIPPQNSLVSTSIIEHS